MPDVVLSAAESHAAPNPASSGFKDDLKRVQELAKKESVASKAYRASLADFLAAVYTFGRKHKNNIDLINFQLNERQLLTAKGKPTPYWNKIAKLVIATRTPAGVWEYDRDKVSMYGRVLANAEECDLNEADAPSHFVAGFKLRLTEARQRSRAAQPEAPSDGLLAQWRSLTSKVVSGADDLSIDMATAGLKPGTHKLLAEVNAEGSIHIIAVLPTSEQSMLKELSRNTPT